MSVLTYLTQSQIKASVNTMIGKTLTRPALLVSDGLAVIYACDVNVNVLVITPTTVYKNVGGYPIYAQAVVYDPLTGQPEVNPSNFPTATNAPLHNVPIARGNYDLIYADVGAAVTLTRQPDGQFQITGFAFEAPGTYTRVPVDLSDLTIGQIEDVSLTARALTYGDLVNFGGYGTVPYGATALYSGANLIGLQS